MHVQIALFDGFDPLDVIAPYEVFHTAGELTAGGTTVELVSVEGPRRVPSRLPPIGLDATAVPDPERADVIVVPGAAGTISLDPQIAGIIGQILSRAARSSLPYAVEQAIRHERRGTVWRPTGLSVIEP
jgi:putative intracellular protease/amidase